MYTKYGNGVCSALGLRRPAWICRNVKQHVVLARDKSPSMAGGKAAEASAATSDLVAELAEPTNKDGFNIAVVDFSTTASVICSLSPATGHEPIDAISVDGSGTDITRGLERALAILEEATTRPDDGVTFLRPVVLLFSDGCHNEDSDPKVAANRLQVIADLVTVAFGDDADEALLRSLATSPQHFYRCKTGRELRAFLAAVGATMSQTMMAGANATQALGTIGQNSPKS